MKLAPSATSSAVLRGAVLALKSCGKPIRSQISKATRETLNPEWQKAVATRAGGSRMDALVFGKGARVAAGNPARLVAASSKRALRKGTNGFVPHTMGRSLEFAEADRTRKSEYVRTYKGGKAHEVARRTLTGFPAPRRSGRVVYPAVSDVMPRFVSMWVQIIVRNIHESLGDK